MAGSDTISAVTENLRSVLQAEGIHFSTRTYDDERGVPASLLPLGRVFYASEAFQYTHGQRPGYVEAEFLVRVLLAGRDPASVIREQQKWVHRVRGAITVAALNTGALSASRPVARADLSSISIENRETLSILKCRVGIRYREG